MTISREVLELAAEVAAELESHSLTPLVIGAVALAAHGYVRTTEDLDFGANLSPEKLRNLAASLDGKGFDVELHEPDASDPLGGVIDVRRGNGLVQIINFDNSPAGGFPRLIDDALKHAQRADGIPGLVAAPLDLILFKLYAGGSGSRNDILHLLEVVELDLDEITQRAKTARVLEKEWTRILRELSEE